MRAREDKCGNKGNFWSPKNTKKFLFHILKQV